MMVHQQGGTGRQCAPFPYLRQSRQLQLLESRNVQEIHSLHYGMRSRSRKKALAVLRQEDSVHKIVQGMKAMLSWTLLHGLVTRQSSCGHLPSWARLFWQRM